MIKLKKSTITSTLTIYGLAHCFVDFSCATIIMNLFPTDSLSNAITIMLIYNFLAFVGQFPLGFMLDYFKKGAVISAMGCLIILLAFMTIQFPIISCTLAGIGNAMFHIGGGLDVIHLSKKKATFSGIFVSTGALGLFLGLSFFSTPITTILGCTAMLLFAIGLLVYQRTNVYHSIPRPKSSQLSTSPKTANNKHRIRKIFITIVLCLLLTICLRSYIGFIMTFPWKTGFEVSLLVVLAIVFGKMVGGIIGDKFGWRRVSTFSLLISAVLFIFSFDNPVCGILAAFLFNFTMPITLMALANLYPSRAGASFGATTAALFIGALPAIMDLDSPLASPIGLCSLTIISAGILFVGLTMYQKVTKHV